MDFTKILLTSHGPKVRDHKLLISVSGSQWIIVVIVRSGGIGAARNHFIRNCACFVFKLQQSERSKIWQASYWV